MLVKFKHRFSSHIVLLKLHRCSVQYCISKPTEVPAHVSKHCETIFSIMPCIICWFASCWACIMTAWRCWGVIWLIAWSILVGLLREIKLVRGVCWWWSSIWSVVSTIMSVLSYYLVLGGDVFPPPVVVVWLSFLSTPCLSEGFDSQSVNGWLAKFKILVDRKKFPAQVLELPKETLKRPAFLRLLLSENQFHSQLPKIKANYGSISTTSWTKESLY